MSKNRAEHNPISAAAIAWVARLDRGPLNEKEHAEFTSWLDADIRHQGAYYRAKAAWQSLGRLKISPRLPTLPNENNEEPDSGRGMSRRRVLIAAAATAAATIVGTAMISPRASRIPVAKDPVDRADQITTRVGEVSRVPLVDGSLIALNTNTHLKVLIADDRRAIFLDRGEAWFQVAKDAKRPFVVTAGPVYVKALGTAFAVRRQPFGTDILVTEGIVETWSAEQNEHVSRVPAGSKIFVSDALGPSRPVLAPGPIENALAWRNGKIALDGETLSEAAAEINRYNVVKITVDPRVTQKPLIGLFDINDPGTFARAVAVISNAVVVERPLEIHISP